MDEFNHHGLTIAETEQGEQAPFLSDYSPKDKPWDTHKSEAVAVSAHLAKGDLSQRRQAQRVHQCAQRLEFGFLPDQDTGELAFKLKRTQFCRVRHCPVCQWRRSLMWFARFRQALPRMLSEHPEYRFVLLTLTVQNCEVTQLRETLKLMNSAFQRLIQRKNWPALGFARSLEITRGAGGMAHPHFHCLLIVRPGYFTCKNYVNTATWAERWRDALRADYTPICDVRAVKPAKRQGDAPLSPVEAMAGAICEVFKYAVKPSDMIDDPSWFLEMAKQTEKTRSVALGGVIREYLSDDEPEDLVTEGESNAKNEGGLYFSWKTEAARYRKTTKPTHSIKR